MTFKSPLARHIFQAGVLMYFTCLMALFIFIFFLPALPTQAREKAIRPQHLRAHYGIPKGGIPGVKGGVGTEESLNYLLGLTEFHHIPPVSATYYVSSDNGGRAAAGDDDNDGLTWATAVRSLCHIDGIIEAATEPIHVVFDSDGGNDVWVTLAGELDCKNGDDWDGSLGPPGANCSDSIDRPCVVLSASDPINPVKLDLLNMRPEQISEDCAGAEYGGNACDDDDDSLFYGRNEAGERDGWLVLQNFAVSHYPNDAERGANAPQKDVVGGNVLTLNLDAGWIQGNGTNFSENHGGFDIHINPVVRIRPPSDFNSDCTTSTDSVLLCADNPSTVYTLTDDCTAENVPYPGCDAVTPFDLQTQQMIFAPFAGGTVIISDQTYRYSINQQQAGRTNSIMRAQNGSDLILLGPMSFENEVHTNHSIPFPGTQMSDNASAITFDATSSGLGQTDTTQTWVVAFAEFTETWGKGGVGDLPAPFVVDYDGSSVGMAWTLNTYGVVVREMENTGVFHLPNLEQDQTNKGTITFDCSSIVATDGVLLFIVEAVDYDSTAAPAYDISARDSYLLESLGYIGYLGAETPTTIAGAITDFAGHEEWACAGDTTCATGFFENGNNDLAIIRPAGAAPATRQGICDTEFRFNMPTNDGETDADKLHRNHNGWIPAYVAGERITAWHFGKP